MNTLTALSLASLLFATMGNASARTTEYANRCTSNNEMLQWAAQGEFDWMEERLNNAFADYEKGKMEEGDVRSIYRGMENAGEPCHSKFFDEWIAAKPKSYAASLSRGAYLLGQAWDARGGGWAHEIPEAQVTRFRQLAQSARRELERSLKLSAHPLFSYERLIVTSQLIAERGLAEKWVAAANRIAPHNTVAREAYMTYLVPRWGGSYEKMWSVVEDLRKSGAPAMRVACFERTFVETWHDDSSPTEEQLILGYDAVIKGICRKPGDYYTRGAAHYRSGHYDKALEDFDTAVTLETDDEYKGSYVYWRGSTHEQMNNFEKALSDFASAEKLNNRSASLAMARIYYNGNDQIKRDTKKSFEICERIAKIDDTGEAFRCLAYHYTDGEGVQRDHKKAAQLMGKAAHMGDVMGKVYYGDHLWNGFETNADQRAAIRWWCEAARAKVTEADERLKEHLGIDSRDVPLWRCEEMAKFFGTPAHKKAMQNRT